MLKLILLHILLRSVGIGSTVIYVDSIRPFFDPNNEMADASNRATRQDNITIISQESKVGAIATCLVTTSRNSYISRYY